LNFNLILSVQYTGCAVQWRLCQGIFSEDAKDLTPEEEDWTALVPSGTELLIPSDKSAEDHSYFFFRNNAEHKRK